MELSGGPVLNGWTYITFLRGTFTLEKKLKAYKSLEAYMCYFCACVQDIMFNKYNIKDVVALKVKVLPKQTP